jgi:hypothetical protein
VTGGSRLTGSHRRTCLAARSCGTARCDEPSGTTPRRDIPWSRACVVGHHGKTPLVETRVSDVTRGTTTASRRHRLTGAEGATQGFGQGPGPRFASAPRMSVMFFLLERVRDAKAAGRTNKLPEGLGSRNTPRRVSVTGSRRETGTKEADLTGPGRNSKVGRVAPELQAKV